MTTRFPRVRRVVPTMGLVQVATRAKTAREHTQRVALFDRLVDDAQLAVLRALLNGLKPERQRDAATGVVTWAELRAADRRKELAGTEALASVVLSRPLFSELRSVVPKLGRCEATRQRYRVSIKTLESQTVLPWPADPMLVKHLRLMPWSDLRAKWPNSAGDWNNLGRTLRATLGKLVGKRSAFRDEIMAAFPWGPSVKRVTNVTPAVYLAIRGKTHPLVRPAFDVLVLTGMRVRSEYLRCTRAHLYPATHQVLVPGTKTDGSRALVSVAPAMWPLVDAGIPSPLKYKALRQHWERACLAAGYSTPHLTLHALRRAHGQWAAAGGVPLTEIKSQLRHATLAMTMDYATTGETERVAAAVAHAYTTAERGD